MLWVSGAGRGGKNGKRLAMRRPKKLRDMRILLIEDDEWIRDSLGLFFEAEGCRILALETAEEGIEALTAESYDVIITDFKLPSMTGLEFFRRIKDTQPRAMKILITAYRTREVDSEALRLGIHGVIDKPLNGDTLLDTVRVWMETGGTAS